MENVSRIVESLKICGSRSTCAGCMMLDVDTHKDMCVDALMRKKAKVLKKYEQR